MKPGRTKERIKREKQGERKWERTSAPRREMKKKEKLLHPVTSPPPARRSDGREEEVLFWRIT